MGSIVSTIKTAIRDVKYKQVQTDEINRLTAENEELRNKLLQTETTLNKTMIKYDNVSRFAYNTKHIC
jgi:hypothetical protein